MAGLHDCDVIVIGAGPGGLTAAAHLANAGRRVLVIDAGDHVGGHMSAFTHAGYEFDIGLHYTSEAPAQRVLRPLGVEVEFQQFDPLGRVRILGPDRQFAVPRGMAAYRERLLEAFPGERGAIEDFLTLAQRLASAQQQIPDAPGLRDLPMLAWRLRALARYARSTAGGYLDSVGASPALQVALLGWTNGSVAMAPSRMSLLAAASLITDYVEDLCYPQGGSQVISDGLADVVRGNGGEVMLGTEADRILVSQGRVRGVQVRGASVDSAPGLEQAIRAPAVVSAVSV
ncbi:MAG: NAD(P)/FAD-dependent oxidoreductase [Candidatus Nanopelagicales bacterium]